MVRRQENLALSISVGSSLVGFALFQTPHCRTIAPVIDHDNESPGTGTPNGVRQKAGGSYWAELALALALPVLMLVFFSIEPHWLNSSIGSRLVAASKEKASAFAKVEMSKVDFEEIGRGNDPEQERLRFFLVSEGVDGRFARLHWSLWGSVALVFILSTAAFAIYCLTFQAERSHDRLIRSYRRAWKIAMGAALAELLIFVPLLTNAIYELTTEPFSRASGRLAAGSAVGGIILLVTSIRTLLRKVPLEFSEPISKEMTSDQAPKLWEAVRGAAQKLQTAPPDHIVVGMELNFYVTELTVIHDAGRTRGRTLYLSYPLLNQLSETEVLVVIGHELGHFIGDDTRITRELYPLRAKVAATLDCLTNSFTGWTCWGFLQFFNQAFGEALQAVARQRELVADRTAAALVSPDAVARTLLKVEVFSEAFIRGLKQAIHERARNPFRASCSGTVRNELLSDDAFWKGLFDRQQKHPMDSHPALSERLAALGERPSVEWARELASAPVRETAFARWFSGEEQLFESLSEQTDEKLDAIRTINWIKTADYDTEIGREVLDQCFPQQTWTTRKTDLYVKLAFLVPFTGILLAMMIYLDSSISRMILGPFFIAFLYYTLRLWKHYSGLSVTLNAGGVTYSHWTRALSFKDVEKMRAEIGSNTYTLTFHFKEPKPRFRQSRFFRSPKTSVPLDLHGLNSDSETIAKTIHRYFTRELEE